MHGDIKPSNFLFTSDKDLKLCDLGLCGVSSDALPEDEEATIVLKKRLLSLEINARWYKSPEVLLGDGSYGKPVDMWAAGCILAELIDLKPLFLGSNDIE